jgi:ABC-type Zn2+ transport system substrate-binding protein/surface adhesin
VAATALAVVAGVKAVAMVIVGVVAAVVRPVVIVPAGIAATDFALIKCSRPFGVGCFSSGDT